MRELVTIITPSYNTSKYISETIKSVISQTYECWEMIIVDDLSNDNSVEIIKSFKDKRIKLFINETNIGAAMSRNFAIRKSKGKWIAFLDSDDIWHPMKLEKQINFMNSNNYSFSYTKYIELDSSSIPNGKCISGPTLITKRRQRNFCYQGCLTVMYNKEEIGLIQIENLKKNNDYAIWLKIINNSNCYLLPEILAGYRLREGSISSSSYIKLIKHHYFLWKNGEKHNGIISLFLTIRNLFFGILKKIYYVKKTYRGDIRWIETLYDINSDENCRK